MDSNSLLTTVSVVVYSFYFYTSYKCHFPENLPKCNCTSSFSFVSTFILFAFKIIWCCLICHASLIFLTTSLPSHLISPRTKYSNCLISPQFDCNKIKYRIPFRFVSFQFVAIFFIRINILIRGIFFSFVVIESIYGRYGVHSAVYVWWRK